MKIIQVKIGLADFAGAPIAFVKDEHNYFAEAIEDGDRYYYRIEGVTIEIEKWEYDRVLENPRLYYCSTALKLHYRIKHVRHLDAQARGHNGPTCFLEKTQGDIPQDIVPSPTPVPTQTSLNILVMTDDPSAREQSRQTLEQHGYSVWTAPNGISGMLLYRFLLPDLVITDILMPFKNGLDVIAEMTEQYPDAKLIAMSAHQDKLDEAVRLGAQHTVRKPLEPEALLTAVQRATREED